MNSLPFLTLPLLFALSSSTPCAAADSGQGAWRELRPDSLRRPIAIALRRNPLQPLSSPAELRPRETSRDEAAALLTAALPGKPQGLVRGQSGQALMLGLRCYPVGGEIALRPRREGREGLLSAKLKAIERDRLVFIVEMQGASGCEVCEVSLPLDPQLSER